MANTTNAFDEFDEFISTESGAEYTTEAVVGLKAVREYFGNFRKSYDEAFKKAKDADKNGDKAKFNAAIKECKKAISDAKDKIADIEENAILNVICPLLMSWLWLILRAVLFAVTKSTDIPNQKTFGNASKQACIALINKCDAELDKYADGWHDRHSVTKESALATVVHDMITECGGISKEDYEILRAYYEDGDDDKNDDDADDATDSDDSKDDGKESDEGESKSDEDDEKDEKLSKKAQEVMDKFNDLSDKDQETVKKLLEEHAEDPDDRYLAYLEAAIDVVSANSSGVDTSVFAESVLETFDCPEFTSHR